MKVTKTKRVAGPKMPCGRRHRPDAPCPPCDRAEHRRKAAVYREAARDAEEKAVEHRRMAAEGDAVADLLDRYAAEHEAKGREP